MRQTQQQRPRRRGLGCGSKERREWGEHCAEQSPGSAVRQSWVWNRLPPLANPSAGLSPTRAKLQWNCPLSSQNEPNTSSLGTGLVTFSYGPIQTQWHTCCSLAGWTQFGFVISITLQVAFYVTNSTKEKVFTFQKLGGPWDSSPSWSTLCSQIKMSLSELENPLARSQGDAERITFWKLCVNHKYSHVFLSRHHPSQRSIKDTSQTQNFRNPQAGVFI